MKEYKTVEFESKDEFIEKKSRFIGYVKPVKTQEEATEFINAIKSKHWDATHNVSAYVLRIIIFSVQVMTVSRAVLPVYLLLMFYLKRELLIPAWWLQDILAVLCLVPAV